MLFSVNPITSTISNYQLTELNRFNHLAYGLSSLCLRLIHVVASINPRLNTGWSGSLLPRQDFHLLATERFVAHWIFQDDGYSGASLIRPGLERVRDLAAEGQIQAVLIYSPDRLSRKYAYQVLLAEELARQGVDAIFIKSPQSEIPEDQLLLQFQGMIAEYERAQIQERSRRRKIHRAKQGQISVLSGAPYGYRYKKRRDDGTPACYEVIESEAEVVRTIFELYTVTGLSLSKICQRLSELGYPTQKKKAYWATSTINLSSGLDREV